VAITFLFKD
jgi:hypothetical protein